MISDANKGIDSLTYNEMNLPEEVFWKDGRKIEWQYTAGGTKLRKKVYNGTDPEPLMVKHYINGYVYRDSTLAFFAFDEGRVRNHNGSLRYEYDLTDHLGNVRATFASENGLPKLLQRDDYYPFGMRFNSTVNGPENNFTYNGKELEDEHGLNWYHYGARFYDPQLGRWHAVDPADEFQSSYAYVGNNPIMLTDPDGMASNPIYDMDGNFLGTDDRGLQGEAIFMNADDFTQGMSHSDALAAGTLASNFDFSLESVLNFSSHFASLPLRPDWDGFLTKAEADAWWQEGTGESLFVDMGKIDLPGVTVEDFNSKRYYSKNFIWGLSNTGKVYGTLDMTLVNSKTGEVKIGYRNPYVSPNGLVLDRYDFSYDGRFLRDIATWVGKPSGTGTAFDIHGYGNAKVKLK